MGVCSCLFWLPGLFPDGPLGKAASPAFRRPAWGACLDGCRCLNYWCLSLFSTGLSPAAANPFTSPFANEWQLGICWGVATCGSGRRIRERRLALLTPGACHPWQLALFPEPPAIILERNRGRDLLLNPGCARSRAVTCVWGRPSAWPCRRQHVGKPAPKHHFSSCSAVRSGGGAVRNGHSHGTDKEIEAQRPLPTTQLVCGKHCGS